MMATKKRTGSNQQSSATAGKSRKQALDSNRNNTAGKQRGTATSLVSVVMGSKSDWETMIHADQILRDFDIPHECRVMSAHRTPHLAAEFAANAEANGVEVIIAAAGGAAHLAGVLAAHTIVPVLGVPMKSALNGLDSLLSTVQMPAGIPVGTLAIGRSGATNAALLAIAILAANRPELKQRLRLFREQQEKQVREATLD